MRLAFLALILLAGCAVAPRASTVAEKEDHARNLSSPVLCYVQSAGNEDDRIATVRVLTSRGFFCGAEAREAGRQEWAQLQAGLARIREQDAQASAQASSDKWDKALRAAAFIGGMMLLAPGFASQPAYQPPVTCQWQINANGTGSTICR